MNRRLHPQSRRQFYCSGLTVAGASAFFAALLLLLALAAPVRAAPVRAAVADDRPPLLTTDEVTATMDMTDMAPPATTATAASSVSATQATTNPNVLYMDDFTDPGSGWPDKLVFDNYYMGYHEPDYYHVEVHVPGDRALVRIPKHTFDNFSAQVDVFADAANTAPQGDFRYGMAVRREGNRYYAFVLSPVTRQWAVLRSDPTGLHPLDSGAITSTGATTDTQAATQAATAKPNDHHQLRVEADGPSLTFFVDDQQVSQLQDATYTAGEIALYVETLDSPRAHVHFNSIEVDKLRKAVLQGGLRCTVDATPALNVRPKPIPDSASAPPMAALNRGDAVTALGRNADGSWLRLRLGDGTLGWASARYLTCDSPAMQLPPVTP